MSSSTDWSNFNKSPENQVISEINLKNMWFEISMEIADMDSSAIPPYKMSSSYRGPNRYAHLWSSLALQL
jgi:hypothetical protein